ncbi:hypothetical protein MM560_G693n161 [Manis javanica]|nr:hypothetical protein MM560_G693n161 [Manis javanica]
MARQLAELWGEGAEPDKLFTLHCNNLELLRSVTLATDTLLFGVLSITRQERASGTMAEVPLPADPRRCGRYGMARMGARSLSPALETVWDSPARTGGSCPSTTSEAGQAQVMRRPRQRQCCVRSPQHQGEAGLVMHRPGDMST